MIVEMWSSNSTASDISCVALPCAMENSRNDGTVMNINFQQIYQVIYLNLFCTVI
jgi:hypothetical protein